MLCACESGGGGDADSTGSTSGTEGSTSSVDEGSSGGESSTLGSEGSSETSGPPPLPEDPFGSGTRLRAVYLDAGQGAVRLQHWYDTELDIDCRFAHDAAWQPRCTPNQGANIDGYLDSDCTQPVMSAWVCGETEPVVSAALPERCAGALARVSAFDVGDAQSIATLYRIDDGECVADFDPDPQEMFHPLTQLADDMFVAADVVDYPVDGALGVRTLESEDGAFEKLEPANIDEGVNCDALSIGGELRCVSANLAYDFGDLHPDSGCSDDPVAYSVFAAHCGDATVVIRSEPNGEQCDPFDSTFREVDGEVDEVYDSTNACMPASRGPNARYWSIGNELPASHAPLIVETYVGGGRGQTIDFAAPNDAFIARGFRWRDAMLDVDCGPVDAEDGTRRCLPDVGLATVLEGDGGLFADAGCTDEPLATYRSNICDPQPPTLVATFSSDSQPCAAFDLMDVADVGAAHSADVYRFDANGGGCTLYMPGEDEEVYEVGSSQGLDSLVEIELVTQ